MRQARARELGLVIDMLERNALFLTTVLLNKIYPPVFESLRRGDAFWRACRELDTHAEPRSEALAGVLWIQSLVRGDDERTQLFELDRTIQCH